MFVGEAEYKAKPTNPIQIIEKTNLKNLTH
jgi:hypothetical protein